MLPSIIHRGQKQDGANTEEKASGEKNQKESANDCKPMGANRQETKEEQRGL